MFGQEKIMSINYIIYALGMKGDVIDRVFVPYREQDGTFPVFSEELQRNNGSPRQVIRQGERKIALGPAPRHFAMRRTSMASSQCTWRGPPGRSTPLTSANAPSSAPSGAPSRVVATTTCSPVGVAKSSAHVKSAT